MSKIVTATSDIIATRDTSHPPHRKVLIVEDDVCLQTILYRLLYNIDPHIEIEWISSADRAWEEIQTKVKGATLPYDLFISDISTPGTKSGIDFWKSCQMRFPHIPFLFTSGMPVEEFFKTFGNSTICPPFLAKPFAVGECRNIMKILLEDRNPIPSEGT